MLVVAPADANKLVKMLYILAFLTQPKVYLFWKKEIQKMENRLEG